MANSLKASSAGIEKATDALDRKGLNKTALEKDKKKLNLCHSTISKFFNGYEISRDSFIRICERLNLNWQEIFEPPPEEEQNNFPKIDTLVQDIRQKVRKNIEETCGKMRVLDMERPIELGSIYTQVNILEKITGRTRVNLNNLEEGFDLENFYRLGLSGIKEKRVEGSQVVENNDKLMVLGKPGSGKTTFLKYLAIQCNKADFLKNHVPVFIPLKQFAETENKPGLLDYISQRLGECGVIETQTKAKQLLKAGRAFVLLDGLDEVRKEDRHRTIKEIRGFSQKFSSSQFVITCRIAAKEYTFEQFTEVEVADFADKQINKFAQSWFEIKKLDDYGKDFIQQLEDNPQIKELATNPLLLTLLCLEFEDSRSFPADRAQLYKRATETLLRKWDDKRGINRGEEVYQQLTVKRKEDLLSQVAFSTFDKERYFFKQEIVEEHIRDYIRNLPDAAIDEKKLDIESEKVLKSIEFRHGLLVERAKGIYSFSHLTFQEYFTAQQIVNDQKIPDLVKHITEKRWREVFLLTAGMLNNADNLLILMKKKVDGLLKEDNEIQEFLCWVNNKAQSVETNNEAAVVRVFYTSLDLSRDLSLDLSRDLSLDLSFILSRDLSLDLSLDLSRDLSLDLSRDLSLDLSLILSLILSRDLSLILSLDLSLDLSRYLSLNLSRYLELDIPQDQKETLQDLKTQLPQEDENPEIIKQWFLDNGEPWSNQFRDAVIQMMKERNIGHDRQFTKEQKESFLEYVNANNLLLDCLEDKNNYITRGVRKEIKSTLYLPFEKVENQFQDFK